jgi:hypothetical protein
MRTPGNKPPSRSLNGSSGLAVSKNLVSVETDMARSLAARFPPRKDMSGLA